MLERPNAVLIYGNGDTRDNYRNLISGLEDMGINVPYLNMDWSVDVQNPDNYGPRSWSNQVHEQVHEQIGNRRVQIVIGHSYGAITIFPYVADLVESDNPPDQITYLSPSACAAEDLEGDKKDDEAVLIYKDNYGGILPAGLLAVRIRPLAATISQEVGAEQIRVIVGEREPSVMQRSAIRKAELFGIPNPIVVPESSHDVDSHPLYVERTLQEVKARL